MSKVNVDSRASILTLVALGSFTPAVMMVAPMLIAVFVSRLGFSDQQAGYIISADMAGMGLATLPALWWVKRINWQRVALFALLLAAVGQVASLFMESFISLFVVRFLTGIAAGTAMSVCMASIGLSKTPDRVFGFWVTGQYALGALSLLLIPWLVSVWGGSSFYGVLAVAMLTLACFVHNIPNVLCDSDSEQDLPVSTKQGGGPMSVVGSKMILWPTVSLLGLFCFYIGLSGVWSYLGRIGEAAGLAVDDIAHALFVSLLAGIAGAFCSASLGSKWGRLLPTALGITIIMMALIRLLWAFSTTQFFVMACVFQFSWTFVLPFLMASIANIDSTGRLIIMTNIIIGGGLAAGPAIAATLLSGASFLPIISMALLCLSLCFLFFVPVLCGFHQKKRKKIALFGWLFHKKSIKTGL